MVGVLYLLIDYENIQSDSILLHQAFGCPQNQLLPRPVARGGGGGRGGKHPPPHGSKASRIVHNFGYVLLVTFGMVCN